MTKAALLLATLVVSGPASAAPDPYQITAEEHAACDTDAVSLCASAFPDPDQVLACMKDKRGQLSPVCAAAVKAGLKRRHIPL